MHPTNAGQATWIQPDPAREWETPERCHILELIGAGDDAQLSIARARVEPGVETQLHALVDVDERYLIVAGQGTMTVGGASRPVGPGDVVVIPRGAPQKIANTGTLDLVFYCLCTPAFTPDCYRDLESPASSA